VQKSYVLTSNVFMPQHEIIMNHALFYKIATWHLQSNISKTFCENILKEHGIMKSHFDSKIMAYFIVYFYVMLVF
jgi:hypothetical protein